MLMAGIQNLPIGRPGFGDFMTMKMVGVSQTLPYPGKLALQTQIAAQDADVSRVALEETRREIVRRVRDAYYDIAFADRALAIISRNQSALGDLARVSEAHFAVGTAAEADVLRARLEQTRLATDASSLAEDRLTAVARLDALLDKPSDAPLGAVEFPPQLLAITSPDSAHAVHFTSATLGARAAGSPLLPLDTLDARAEQASPVLREHEAMIGAQQSRVALARKASLPDVTVNVSYGQRNALSDMITATVSVPLALQRGRKQDADVAAAVADRDALESEHREQVNSLHTEIATQYSNAERARTQLALLVSAMLPQAQATLASTSASFQVGRAGLEQVVDAQAMTFNAETSYYRSLADFGKALAALEQIVGTEVLR
jgi:outer membrane protein TolC